MDERAGQCERQCGGKECSQADPRSVKAMSTKVMSMKVMTIRHRLSRTSVYLDRADLRDKELRHSAFEFERNFDLGAVALDLAAFADLHV